MKPHLTNGFGSLPSIDPFFLSSVYINRSIGAFNVEGRISNSYVRGAKFFTIKKVRLDPKKLVGYTLLHFPKIEIKGQYDLKGTVLMFPLMNKGNFTGNFSKYLIKFTLYD